MLPPGAYKALRVTVPASDAIGGLGWKTYRRVLHQISSTFGEHEEMMLRGRNEARKVFHYKNSVTGDDQYKSIREANIAIDEMRMNVVAAYEDRNTGNVQIKVSREQLEYHGRKIETFTPQEVEKEIAKVKDNVCILLLIRKTKHCEKL